MSLRRYSDHDVALILRRALELEEEGSRTEVPDGVTLMDLREVARGVGIDPALVERAAAELDVEGSATARRVAEEAAVVREIRALPRRLEPEELRALVEVVDRALPEQGTVTQALGEIRWTSRGRFRSTQVALRPGEGETVVSVEESLGEVKTPLRAIPTIWATAAGLAIGAQEGAPQAVMLALVLGGAGALVGQGLWRLVLDHHVQRVRTLVDRLLGSAGGGPALP